MSEAITGPGAPTRLILPSGETFNLGASSVGVAPVMVFTPLVMIVFGFNSLALQYGERIGIALDRIDDLDAHGELNISLT